MGSDLAPFMAIQFHYYFENKLTLNLKKSNLHKACSFTNTFRFIDELCAINDSSLLDPWQ